MQLNPYGQDAVHLAVALVNDRPDSVADLVDRCRSAGLVIDLPVGESDLADAQAVIEQWCAVVDAEDDEQRSTLLNELLAESSAHPRLVRHGSDDWHLHFRDDGISLGRKLRALISTGTALHLAGRGMGRLGRCALADCPRVYADTSRTGRQRFCSPACANRAAVRRHRSRRGAA